MTRSWFAIAAVGACLCAAPAGAQEPPATPAANPEAAETGPEISKAYQDAYAAWRKDYLAARKAGTKSTTPRPDVAAFGARMLAAVEAAPDPRTAAQGLLWIIQKVRRGEPF